MNLHRSALATSFFAGIFAVAVAAGAQAPAADSPLTEAQIARYAAAIVDLSAIEARYDPRLEAGTGDARVELEAEMNERMLAAVRRHNLDRRTFNLISARIRGDPALARQVRNQVARLTVGF